MEAVSAAPFAPATASAPPAAKSNRFGAFLTLARRRFALSARTPREIVVPLLTPILFSLVIAPALATMMGRAPSGLDYMTFVAIGTVGLLVPINCMFAGI